jgi:hypothetical protein
MSEESSKNTMEEYELRYVCANASKQMTVANTLSLPVLLYFFNRRFGTNILEAYALAIIKNNYFTWLYDYKSKNPGSYPAKGI